MSRVYLYRLNGVISEFTAARAAMALLTQRWGQLGNDPLVQGVTTNSLKGATHRLERTYFVRLYAESEGILKDHLAINHPASAFGKADKPRVDEVISRVVQAEGLAITPPLRGKLDAARDFRNSIAHAKQEPTAEVRLTDGGTILGALVDMLPDPRR